MVPGLAVLELMIPILAIVLGIGVAFWSIYWGHRKTQLQYQERRLMIERGMVPPPFLPEEENRRVTPADCLRRGTIMVFLGIGLAISYLILRGVRGGPPEWLLGVGAAVVGLIGIGNLVYYLMVRNQSATEPMNNR